ncbi:hypothetical protein CQW23_25437 [Capsicum baccatum]|uniref:Ubiquitin-like protease family profile domain-containing protein n=1 Tax=Capsicum baccatum TaxID=33114 RepID=A0A2G2VKZ3_CAPBA|nr:hypothetical protein CQW23_25437 [Capsicum baccatum]
MADLVTLISKIPVEVVKALKNEENKQSEEEKTVDQQQSHEEGSKKHESPYKEDIQDEVGGTITDSIQAAVDTILFDLSTPLTTKSLDVREREATKAKAPTKKERKKSRILRSPYITKYDSGSKDAGNSDKKEKLKYAFNAYKGKLAQQTGLVNEISFDVDYVQNIPQQAYDSLDCDVFVSAYAEILSEGQQVHSCGFDDRSQRALYVSLLWYYRVEKANEGYTSDNDDPPWPRNSVLQEIDESAIVTLE